MEGRSDRGKHFGNWKRIVSYPHQWLETDAHSRQPCFSLMLEFLILESGNMFYNNQPIIILAAYD